MVQNNINLNLDAKLEGTIATARRGNSTRVNWDTDVNAKLRERMASSWLTKSDMYKDDDSFTRFCDRVGIHTNTLRRYLNKLKAGDVQPKKRGRPTLLSESVMRHICEGSFCFYLLLILFPIALILANIIF